MAYTRSTFALEAVIDGVLVLRDLDIGMSVTNDAEAVVRCCLLELPGWDHAWPIVYRDTDGHYDALLHHGGRFIGYRALGGARTAAEAVHRLRGGLTGISAAG